MTMSACWRISIDVGLYHTFFPPFFLYEFLTEQDRIIWDFKSSRGVSGRAKCRLNFPLFSVPRDQKIAEREREWSCDWGGMAGIRRKMKYEIWSNYVHIRDNTCEMGNFKCKFCEGRWKAANDSETESGNSMLQNVLACCWQHGY